MCLFIFRSGFCLLLYFLVNPCHSILKIIICSLVVANISIVCHHLQGYEGFEDLRKFIKHGSEFSKDVGAILHERYGKYVKLLFFIGCFVGIMLLMVWTCSAIIWCNRRFQAGKMVITLGYIWKFFHISEKYQDVNTIQIWAYKRLRSYNDTVVFYYKVYTCCHCDL